MLKNCFFGCCYALLYSNAFKFNLYEILEVKVIWRPCQRSHVSCLSTFSKGFCSETTGSISFKFHMQSSSKGGKKVYIFDLGHMTKLVAMPIYGKNLKKKFVTHKDGSNEGSQHMFSLRNKKNYLCIILNTLSYLQH